MLDAQAAEWRPEASPAGNPMSSSHAAGWRGRGRGRGGGRRQFSERDSSSTGEEAQPRLQSQQKTRGRGGRKFPTASDGTIARAQEEDNPTSSPARVEKPLQRDSEHQNGAGPAGAAPASQTRRGKKQQQKTKAASSEGTGAAQSAASEHAPPTSTEQAAQHGAESRTAKQPGEQGSSMKKLNKNKNAEALPSAQGGAPSQRRGKKPAKWWASLEDDDPISLDPIAKLAYEPFNLPSSDEVPCWFDPKMLGNYLVSAGNFSHPATRRQLNKEDCERLDAHLAKCRLRRIGVLEVFEFQERMQDPTERIRELQAQAQGILQSLFAGRREAGQGARGGAAGRGGDRGGAGGAGRGDGREHSFRHDQDGGERGRGRGRGGRGGGWVGGGEEGPGLMIIDDDEAMFDFPAERGGGGRGGEGRGVGNGGQARGRGEESWPALLPSAGPIWGGEEAERREAGRRVGEAEAGKAEATTAWDESEMPSVFHVSFPASPSIKSKHLTELFSPHPVAVKWLNSSSAMAILPFAPEAAALRSVEAHNPRDLTVVRLCELRKVVDSKNTDNTILDYRARPRRRVPLPSAGELSFLLSQLRTMSGDAATLNAAQAPVIGDDDDSDERLQGWLQARWAAQTSATARGAVTPSNNDGAAYPPGDDGSAGGVGADEAEEGRGGDSARRESQDLQDQIGREAKPTDGQAEAGVGGEGGGESGGNQNSTDDACSTVAAANSKTGNEL